MIPTGLATKVGTGFLKGTGDSWFVKSGGSACDVLLCMLRTILRAGLVGHCGVMLRACCLVQVRASLGCRESGLWMKHARSTSSLGGTRK